MTIGALSTGGLSQYVLASSNLTQTQQAWQTLQQSLASGNLSAAQTAFTSYQQLNQNLTKISGSSSASTQLTTDMTALGTALSSGDLSSAQSAFATVQAEMSSSPSQAMSNAMAAMTQVEGWVSGLLDSADTTSFSASSSDPATEALSSEYGGVATGASTSLNVYA